MDCCPIASRRSGVTLDLRRLHQAGAGAPSVTVSSWPTVSRPNNSGMKAPIVTTTNMVPKNIVAEPVCGSIRKGASTPEKTRPVDSPKACPRPRSAVRELLGEVNPEGGRGRKRGETGHQRACDHHHRRVGSSSVGHHHQEKAGQRAGERIEYRPAPPDDLHQEAGETLSRYARGEDEGTYAKARGDGGALIDQSLWQQDRNHKKAVPQKT